MNQNERESIMDDFREGVHRVLITTDIWARGLDITQVGLVVNYDLPGSRENYLHRIGRTGRFGRNGIAVNLIKDQEAFILKDIELFYSTHIAELPLLLDSPNTPA